MKPIYLAMWSGPRNISTAMMRAWENRSDTQVVDEPFYAHYLEHTKLDHPGAEEVIASGEVDWQKVVQGLTDPLPDGVAIYYQKHMTHHLLPHMSRDWLAGLENFFLIRQPREVLLSYRQKRAEVSAEDLGFPQQAEIFEYILNRSERVPVVIDSTDFLKNPARLLRLCCERLNVDFDPNMLVWPSGPRESDGVWAKHWYDSVWSSTGFAPYQSREGVVPTEYQQVLDQCQPYYDQLSQYRIG